MAGSDYATARERVPDRFEDLQRHTAEDRARFAAADVERRVARSQGLIGDRAFMDVSGRVSRWATVAGTLLILAGLRAPLWEALKTLPGLADTVHVMTEEGVATLKPAATHLLAEAKTIRAKDERGVDLARRGLACLNDTGPCPVGRSPLR